MAKCENCGSHISEDFARVFGNENKEVYACPKCSARSGIAEVSVSRQ